jgi:anti-anti-sigma factor
MAPAALEDLDIRVQEKIQLLSWGQLLTLDLSAVTYINSTFVGYLSAWYNSVQAKGGQLLLSKLNSRAKDVLNLVGLSQVLMFDN